MPALIPLTFHWYAGVVPPLVGVAVKVTELPEHTGFTEAPIVTLTGRFGFTVMVTMLEVAGLAVAQVALDVSTQLTASLFKGTYVNEALFVPVLIPLTFHW